MNKFLFENLVKGVEEREGFSATPYQDSLGVWTIGHGITNLTERQSDLIVRDKLQELIGVVEEYAKNKNVSLDEFRLTILVEMAYQLGFAGLKKFKKMWAALADMDYEKASKEMLDSKWAKQTNVRARYLAKKMLMGG